MKISFKNLLLLASTTFLVFISSCRKDDFDAPPAGGTDPDLVANTTIADLKAGYLYGVFDTITTDVIIAGIVTADDKSGNFYKTIIIQDETAAIAIRLDVSDFYTRYPIGRRIFVKCKGLILGDYSDLIQLGGYIDNSTPSQPSVEPIAYSMVDKYIFPGVYGLTVTPTIVTIPQITASLDSIRKYQNVLIQLNDVEFISSDTSKTYADMVNQQSANRVVQDCSNQQVEIRTSNYATFGGDGVPNGNGTITTIFSVYSGSPQLYIRNPDDVKLDSVRCGGGPLPGGGVSENFSTQTVNTDIALTGWSNIAAVGNRYWRTGEYSGNKYAQATAYGSALPSMESWLITPALNLSVDDSLSFISSWGYYEHDGLSVWISTDFNGSNFSSATWTPLSCTLAVQADGQFTWIPSGDVPLTTFSGTGYIGFKYVGDGTTNTTTWRIDDVVVH